MKLNITNTYMCTVAQTILVDKDKHILGYQKCTKTRTNIHVCTSMHPCTCCMCSCFFTCTVYKSPGISNGIQSCIFTYLIFGESPLYRGP